MAEIARMVTDSKLSNQEIINIAGKADQSLKEKVCLEIDQKVKECHLPMSDAFSLIRDDFNQIAVNCNMDQAVLFLIYMDWLNKQFVRVKIK
jgi:hypothetical protein